MISVERMNCVINIQIYVGSNWSEIILQIILTKCAHDKFSLSNILQMSNKRKTFLYFSRYVGNGSLSFTKTWCLKAKYVGRRLISPWQWMYVTTLIRHLSLNIDGVRGKFGSCCLYCMINYLISRWNLLTPHATCK